VLGSPDFVERLRALAGPLASDPPLREARQLAGLDPGVILAAVTEYYGLESGALTRRHDRHIARSVAAWLCRRYSEATLSELAGRLGQSRADSVPSLVRRMEARLRTSSQLVEDVKAIVALLSTAPDRPGITTQDRPLSGQRTPTRKPRN
jgi:putative transposase